MSFLILANEPQARAARRSFLGRSSLLLSGAAVALLAGRDALAAKGSKSTEADARVLNTALGAEFEAIAAYQVGADSGLLQKQVLDLAVTFQGHHKAHADVQIATSPMPPRAFSAMRRCTGRCCATRSVRRRFRMRSCRERDTGCTHARRRCVRDQRGCCGGEAARRSESRRCGI